MNENELFFNEMKRWHEMLTMTFKYYLPNGKPLPPTYEEAFFELYKVSESGVLEWLSKEPLSQDLPVQVDLFTSLTATPSVQTPDNGDGTLLGDSKPKPKT